MHANFSTCGAGGWLAPTGACAAPAWARWPYLEPWVATMTEWAKRMAWTEEDPLDHQRAEYHDALVTYANRIMDDIWR